MAKNNLYEDDVLVIGLGRFGSEAAAQLHRLGHRVVAIEACHASSFKLAVIGIGSMFEASVLTAGNLPDAGIPSIWAKAVSLEHARILERIGSTTSSDQRPTRAAAWRTWSTGDDRVHAGAEPGPQQVRPDRGRRQGR